MKRTQKRKVFAAKGQRNFEYKLAKILNKEYSQNTKPFLL